ncbi:hypothetical protein HNQ92_005139 [Rhabdobacter roseus]|jgi:hypothetical protein|uniref:Uncharacterized protein n=1 Tax=Rhabdobacter roseus TaxID=1655419 RepID=A0A840TZL8_9BACT|nr:hypothetical protein [Rhabdobacter roseus]
MMTCVSSRENCLELWVATIVTLPGLTIQGLLSPVQR